MDHRDFTFECKALREDGSFTGLLSVYGVVDEYRDSVEPGAFTKTLEQNGGTVPLLWQHDTSNPIGTLKLTDSPEALRAEGNLVLTVPQARIVYDLLKAGVVRGLSIGFKSVQDAVENGIRKLKEIRLFEGSLVTIPANPAALVESVKEAGAKPEPKLEPKPALFSGGTVRDFENWLHSTGGFSKSQSKAVAAGGWKSLAGAPDDEEVAVLEFLQQANAKFQRR